MLTTIGKKTLKEAKSQIMLMKTGQKNITNGVGEPLMTNQVLLQTAHNIQTMLIQALITLVAT